MRSWLLAQLVVTACSGTASAQQDKKTDDLKSADPDTGESDVEEQMLDLLPNPFEKKGTPFYILAFWPMIERDARQRRNPIRDQRTIERFRH